MLTARYQDGRYLERVPQWHAPDAPWKSAQVLMMLARHQLSPRSVCDVGCGAGEILARLQGSLGGARLVGYDISNQAIALCKPKENAQLTFRHGDLLREPGEVFDLLLSLDVLEHVADYLGFLAALRPRARWFIFHIPLDLNLHAVARGSRHLLHMRERYGHLHYFTAETALATLSDAGFRVVDSAFTWDHEPAPARANAMKAALTNPGRWATHLLEALVFRLSPSTAARWRPGYNLLVLANTTS